MLPGRRFRRHASCSTAGRRTINEDRVATLRLGSEAYVVAVADGMGGMAAGEIASGVAMTAFVESVRSSVAESPRRMLQTAFTAADTAVRDAVTADREGMGTTLTAAIVRERDVWVGNVGDSRAVLVLPDEVIALSRDHSFIAEAVRSGRMTELEALQSPERHVISRALGEGDASPDIKYHSLRSYDDAPDAMLLVGSDGLFNFIGDTEILEISAEEKRPATLVERLIRRAIDNGSDDNVSAAVVALASSPRRPRWLVRMVAAVVVLLALAAAAYPLRRNIAAAAATIRHATAPDRGVKRVRLPITGSPHLPVGSSGRLCTSAGDCFGTWRVALIDGDSMVLEIRTERGGRR